MKKRIEYYCGVIDRVKGVWDLDFGRGLGLVFEGKRYVS